MVEKAEPTSQSVVDACNLRNDPLSATKLVSTPATIMILPPGGFLTLGILLGIINVIKNRKGER